MKRLRIALYSHDTMGLGHIRRNLLIARQLAAIEPEPAILIISGTPESLRLPRPSCSDVLALPGYKKLEDGTYASRSLPIELSELVSLRAMTIQRAVNAFRPDVLIVDKVPTGTHKELLPTLHDQKARRGKAILGLRDILDDPESTAREWKAEDYEASIEDYYDDVWVYGDPNVFDVREEYAFSKQLSERVKYMGYLAAPKRRNSTTVDSHLCLVGGGQDGFELARAFAQADFGEATRGIVITGPFMATNERSKLDALARRRPNLTIKQFASVEPHIARARKVVSMGGYNTICEILASGKPALIVPRTKPRQEQAIRADRLAAMGAVTALSPDKLTPDAISGFLASETNANRPHRIDLNGCTRVVRQFGRYTVAG